MRIALASLLAALLGPLDARAFSQWGGVTPVGHEWLTSRAALEVLGDAHVGPHDPRRSAPLSQARARDVSISDGIRTAVRGSGYRSRSDLPLDTPYNAIYSAVVGVRWVDMAGTSVAMETARSHVPDRVPNCFNAVAQNPSEVQHDHFLRARGEAGGSGALQAIRASVGAFRKYFVAAATAATGTMHVVDGGAAESKSVLVERPAFLLGRAAHLLQDSFSTEHGIRRAGEGFLRVHGIKTFVCSRDAFRHSAHYPVSSSDRYHDGDVIWRSAPDTMHVAQVDAAALRPWALAALEATKDLWAAFLRVRGDEASGRAQAARREADALVQRWLAFDEADVRRNGHPDTSVDPGWSGDYVRDQAACDRAIGYSPAQVAHERALCVYNMVSRGRSCESGGSGCDAQLKIPYDWTWRSGHGTAAKPPDGFMGVAAPSASAQGAAKRPAAATAKRPPSSAAHAPK